MAFAASFIASLEAGTETVPDNYESRRVQTLRGIACILLVAFHTIGSEALTGMKVDDDSGYRLFANLFTYLRMPLFTFLSGFVYAYRPAQAGQVAAFARRKFARLVLPLLCVSTLFYAATEVSQANTLWQIPLDQMWRIYVFNYAHYWFLQAIILIFAAVALLDRFKLLSTPGRYAVAFVVAVTIHLTVPVERDETVPFSALDALYLAPFFLLGLGANRFRAILMQPFVSRTCVLAALVGMVMHAAMLLQGQTPSQHGMPLELFIGVTGTLALIALCPASRWLERIGAYSYAVYLFHPFFVGAARAVSKPIEVTAILFTACLIAGVLGPMVLERVLGNVPVVKTLLFGRRTRTSAAGPARVTVGARAAGVSPGSGD
jgi:glucan biosynthesis protein C